MSFQEDGHFDSTTFLNSTIGIGSEDLADFTLCIRINLNTLRGREQYFLSYVSTEFDEALSGAIIQDVKKPMKLRFCQETKQKKICINHILKNDIFQVMTMIWI